MWSAPEKLVQPPTQIERLEQLATAASQTGSGASHLPALSQVQVETINNKKQEQQQKQLPSAYSVEFREKFAAWQLMGTTKENSLLLKDLRPGTEYSFKVYAHAPGGYRSSPTPEFKYVIPNDRKKPGGTQAMFNGVLSGILLFIACIVLAVCGVNKCNKRRKKKDEKG